MTDKRFFQSEGPFTLGAIATRVGAVLQQPERGEVLVHDVAELCRAGSGDLSIFHDSRHTEAFADCHATAILTNEKLSSLPHNGCAILISSDPRLAFARAGELFYPRL